MTRRRSQPVSGELPLPAEPKDVVKGITGRIKHFSPSWFSVTMGTGIPATLLLSIPFPWARHLRIPSLIFLLLDTALFCTFTLLMVLRYVRWPWIWTLTWTHATHSLFIGTFPMSLFTLISGGVSVSQAFGGGLSWVYAMAVCWWISVVVAIGVAIAVPFLSYVTHRNFPESLTASLILPVVPLITGAAVGAVLSDHLYAVDPEYAQHIWMTSYVILGPGLLLALMIMALYIQRLTFHHIPPNETIVSSFLPLGPTGLGGFSALKLGAVAVHLLPLRAASSNQQFPEFAGVALWGFGLVLAMLLWGLGVWFGLIAVAGFAWRAREGNLRFNLGYWGLTFPLASLTLSTQLIGQELDSFGFKVTSTVFTFTMVTLWVCVSIPTCRGVLSGSRFVFAAPCLSKPEDRNSNAALASKTSGTSDAAGLTTPNNSARTSSDGGGSHSPRRKEETEAEEEERKEGLMTEKTGTGGE